MKLVTSTLPDGLSLGEEGDPQNDQQVQSMFFNMMTGNIQVTHQTDNKSFVKMTITRAMKTSIVRERLRAATSSTGMKT